MADVSIITPTYGREAMLPAIAACVLAQQAAWEWLVLDDSTRPSEYMQRLAERDHRVRYWHSPERRPIGAKRNWLLGKAKHSAVAHFDDDDWYGPDYLSWALGEMERRGAALVKLSGFFSHGAGGFGYCDLTALPGDLLLLYGFSYVYRRAGAQFEATSSGEEGRLIRALLRAGEKVAALPDTGARCLHRVHAASTSNCYPTHTLPGHLLGEIFPEVSP